MPVNTTETVWYDATDALIAYALIAYALTVDGSAGGLDICRRDASTRHMRNAET